MSAAIVRRWLSSSRIGALRVELPDRSTWELGDTTSDRAVTLRVRRWAFFTRVIAQSDIGLGESYMAGAWDCDDLVAFFRLLLQPTSLARRRRYTTNRIAAGWRRRGHPRSATRDVRAHYDLGNDFFRLFLDDTMTYSAGVFATQDATLEEAQHHKLDGICRRIGLGPGLDVLDVGGGWGSFAIHAASTYGCRVRSITLSAAQHALARDRVRAAGLESVVDVQLCDYRDVLGRFDRIVAIEMFEAVGSEHYGTFFRTCERLLRPGGSLFLQTSTYPDAGFDAYRRDDDWIRKHIFPGGLLASMNAIRGTLGAETNLHIASTTRIGRDYATTLHCWRERYLRRRADVAALGFDEPFIRKWELYLAMCEAAFATGRLDTVQLVIDSKDSPALGTTPYEGHRA
jgi:cyclopropane-fatty-acyl-phospholipid synthase